MQRTGILLVFSTLIKNQVGDDGVPAILQYGPFDLYLTDRKQTMTILQKDTRTPLHICRQGLPSFILISNKPHCWAIKKGSLWNKLAWWPLPASSIPMPPLSPTTNHHHTPLLFTLSHISRDIISFYTWDYSRKGQSQQVFYKKNASWCSVQCTDLASTPTQD